ncbi:MAG: TolC family protein [Elusimicrobiota bacterium]|jgi:outer membrane protein TolC|nr:TolC family protein [Elusimicrobiota bacterium]
MKLFKAVIVLFAVAFTASAYGEIITIGEYLSIVEENNPQLQSIQASIESAKDKIAETERALTPFVLSVGGNYTDDEFSGLASGYKEVKTNAYNAAITKQFITGTGISIGASASDSSSIADSLIPSLADRDTKTLAPFVSIQQSLWKDFVIGYTRASINAARASAKAALYNLEYSKQSFILGAKSAYWNFAYAKTNTAYREASLARYQQLLEWNQKRYRLDLAERADLLQAQASQKSGELNLRIAVENEKQARRAFNQYINTDINSKEYDVIQFEDIVKNYSAIEEIQKKGTRADVLAAIETEKAAKYNQKAAINNAGPDVVVSGQYTANGAGTEFSDAQKADKPVYVIGAKITLPLDFIRQSKVNKSYKAAAISAEKSAENAKIQEQTDWVNLFDKWKLDLLSLEMSQSIQSIQKEYVSENRKLLQRGRTTTNLVIQSEESLDNATLNVFSAMLSLINDYEKAAIYYNNQEDLK